MARTKHNLPRAFREPRPAPATGRSASSDTLWAIGAGLLLAAAMVSVWFIVAARTGSRAAAEHRIDREVGALLAGIPQRGATLGNPAAPVALEVFADLKDPDSRSWFLTQLPPIVRHYVRPGALKLQLRAYKTNTYSPREFVKQQTAALAAGAQNRLWNFVDTFYHEQRNEFTPYATETFLTSIARQIPGLNFDRWHADRQTGRREEQITNEDQIARTLALHVTPSFRIGRTGGPMRNFSGHAILKHGEQHPIALIEAKDIGQAIRELAPRRP